MILYFLNSCGLELIFSEVSLEFIAFFWMLLYLLEFQVAFVENGVFLNYLNFMVILNESKT